MSRGGLSARIENLADLIVSSDTRQRMYVRGRSFITEQPLLASFIVIQIILSFFPVAIFASFVVGTIFVSFLSAIVFSLFWIGVALLVLIPTLFITVSLAIGVWVWAVASFLIAQWMYSFIPVNVQGGLKVEMPSGKTMIINKTGDGFADIEAKIESDPLVADLTVPMTTTTIIRG